jgi:hypothetical protein
MATTLDSVVATGRVLGLRVQLQHIGEIAEHFSRGRWPGRTEKMPALACDVGNSGRLISSYVAAAPYSVVAAGRVLGLRV